MTGPMVKKTIGTMTARTIMGIVKLRMVPGRTLLSQCSSRPWTHTATMIGSREEV